MYNLCTLQYKVPYLCDNHSEKVRKSTKLKGKMIIMRHKIT